MIADASNSEQEPTTILARCLQSGRDRSDAPRSAGGHPSHDRDTRRQSRSRRRRSARRRLDSRLTQSSSLLPFFLLRHDRPPPSPVSFLLLAASSSSARAAGGVGLIVTGGIAPNNQGRASPFAGKMSTPSEARAHEVVTATVHETEGALVAMQILHTGRCAASAPRRARRLSAARAARPTAHVLRHACAYDRSRTIDRVRGTRTQKCSFLQKRCFAPPRRSEAARASRARRWLRGLSCVRTSLVPAAPRDDDDDDDDDNDDDGGGGGGPALRSYAYHPFSVAPSAKKAPIGWFTPSALSASDVRGTIDDFARCAALARSAGYDGVEIMGSEGYLINQFLAARTNLRDDEWGGAYENRMRLAVETVRAVRAACGDDFIVIFRLSMLDLVEVGGRLEMMAAAWTIRASRCLAHSDVQPTNRRAAAARLPRLSRVARRGKRSSRSRARSTTRAST